MVSKALERVWTDQAAVTEELALKALQYIDISDRTIVRAKEPGFTDEGWEELGELLDKATFTRKSKDRDPITWENYRPILTNWATRTEFWYKFKRLTQAGNLVFLELEEHTTPLCGKECVEHTMSVFEFNDDAKIVNFEVYFMIH